MTTTHADYRLSQLDELEAESIHIFREVAAEFEKPVLLFSGGKDSIVMARLAEKAFWPARIPFPLMHVDTGHNFSEVIDYRDRRVAELGIQLVCGAQLTVAPPGSHLVDSPVTVGLHHGPGWGTDTDDMTPRVQGRRGRTKRAKARQPELALEPVVTANDAVGPAQTPSRMAAGHWRPGSDASAQSWRGVLWP